MRCLLFGALWFGIAGCTYVPPATELAKAVTVPAKFETAPVATQDDAADDPAIWRNAADPANSLIVATDKRAGIHVYDLRGQKVSFTASPRLNNVDLRDNVMIAGEPSVLVVASDRQDEANAKMAVFRLDTDARQLVLLTSIPVGRGEAYGMCLWQRKADNALFGFLILKDGRIDQIAFDLSSAEPRGKVVRSLKLATQSEGCVVDDRTGQLYVAEEDVGLWRFDADPAGSNTATSIAKTDSKNLVADAEGLAIAGIGTDGGYLVASSQGDNAYALYRLPDLSFAGRFKIGAGAIDGTQETDGIEVITGDFGPQFPNGIMIAQDGDNAPDTQNFKLVDWQSVRTALQLR